MLVSVIIPVYNSGSYLHRCVDSLLTQSYTDFELILVDDGSCDSSSDICDEYARKDTRVKSFHKENAGVSSARNLGLDNATGEFVVFVDSDDWVDIHFLEHLYTAAHKEKSDIAVCEIINYYGHKIKISNNSLIEKGKCAYIKHQIIAGFTSVCNMMFNREFIEANRLRFEKVRYSEDFIFSIKAICLSKRITYVANHLYYYDRTNEISALHHYPDDMYKDLLYGDALMIDFFKEEGYFDDFKREIYWRVLANKRELVLSVNKHKEFKKLLPESKRYILDCPLINQKLRVMMWLLSHNLDFIVRIFVLSRKILRR